MSLAKNKTTKTAEASEEESKEIESNAEEVVQEATTEEVPGFDTGEDKTGEASEASTAVAAVKKSESRGLAVSQTDAAGLTSRGARELVQSEDDEDDLDGLAVDAFSFPMVTQKDGVYKIGDEMLGPKFECILQSTKKKFLHKDGAIKDDDEQRIAYSYDLPGPNACDSSGKPISEIVEEWVALGTVKANVVVSRYLDIDVIIQGGEHDGSFCTVQVSPTSVTKVSGKIMELKAKKVKSVKHAIVEFSAPNAVGTGQKKFYPFLLKFVRLVNPVEAAAE
jgi:hypothetical protein